MKTFFFALRPPGGAKICVNTPLRRWGRGGVLNAGQLIFIAVRPPLWPVQTPPRGRIEFEPPGSNSIRVRTALVRTRFEFDVRTHIEL